MNVVVTIVLVMLAIAAMMATRLIIFRRALDARLRAGHDGSNCNTDKCFQGCVSGQGESTPPRTRNQNALKRSDSHAS